MTRITRVPGSITQPARVSVRSLVALALARLGTARVLAAHPGAHRSVLALARDRLAGNARLVGLGVVQPILVVRDGTRGAGKREDRDESNRDEHAHARGLPVPVASVTWGRT